VRLLGTLFRAGALFVHVSPPKVNRFNVSKSFSLAIQKQSPFAIAARKIFPSAT
jgi:hypothetical protein